MEITEEAEEHEQQVITRTTTTTTTRDMTRSNLFRRGSGVVVADVEDLVVRVKNGQDDELGAVLSELRVLAAEGRLEVEDEQGSGLILALLHRLGNCKSESRVKILSALRSLSKLGNESKERMANIEALTIVVRSLSRDVNERREAIVLLLDLSDVLKVRQRLGRIRGSIVMLATLRNGDDQAVKHDAEKLLGILSCNPQNVLLMAEAGYFIPLIHYLNEGSDMNKILMATAISRMFLSEQMKYSLGEDGSIDPLVKMLTSGNLEAKLSALGALHNLSTSTQNADRLIDSGLIPPLLQLLFSVTSVLMNLREPASAILSTLTKSDHILRHKDVALQILSLLNLTSPAIQLHLLHALNSIAEHPNAQKARSKIRQNGAMQLLLPFLTHRNAEIRILTLNLVFHLSKDAANELTEQIKEPHLDILIKIISSPSSEAEKAAAVGTLSNLPVKDKKITEFLTQANLLPVLVSLLQTNTSSSPTSERKWLLEGIAGVFVLFTVPWDKKLQSLAVANGVIPCLVKLVLEGSVMAKSKAATSLAQLSQNSLVLRKAKPTRWLCGPPSSETHCEVHNCRCTIKTTFCIVKAGAVNALVQALGGKDREADEAVLEALATLMLDDIWENGSKVIEKASGIPALMRVVEVGDLKAQEKAMWMLERIFRLEAHREWYGEAAQVLLIDLAHRGDPVLQPMVGNILAHLELLQMQSSYF